MAKNSFVAEVTFKLLAPVKPGDAMGFTKFHNFVLKCETFFKSVNWNSLERPETLCVLVSKLPDR